MAASWMARLSLARCALLAVALDVEVYWEALCPDSTRFLRNQLKPLAANASSELMQAISLKFEPYGNAKVSKAGAIECQHGPLECEYNLAHTCAQDMLGQQEYLRFMFCTIDKANPEIRAKPPVADVVTECAKAQEAFEILSCSQGAEGAKLQEPIRKATEAANVTQVPWVTLDGTWVEKCEFNLQDCICAALPESERPDACVSAGVGLLRREDNQILATESLRRISSRMKK